MKYISIRHWDYWYSFYEMGAASKADLNAVEFHVFNKEGNAFDESDDNINDGNINTEFFHFDFYTLPALKKMIENNEYVEGDAPDYHTFMEKAKALDVGQIDFFIGGLYYPSFHINMEACNAILSENKSVFDKKSQSVSPHYATIFIGEQSPLTPDLIVQWASKISTSLFNESLDFQISNMPTSEETLASYKAESIYLP